MNFMIYFVGSEGNIFIFIFWLVEYMEMIYFLLFREYILKNKYLVLSILIYKIKLLINIEFFLFVFGDVRTELVF